MTWADDMNELAKQPQIARKTNAEPLRACPHSTRAMVSFFTQTEYYEECDACLRARLLAALDGK